MAPDKFSAAKLKTISKLNSQLLTLDLKSIKDECIGILILKLEYILSMLNLPAVKAPAIAR